MFKFIHAMFLCLQKYMFVWVQESIYQNHFTAFTTSDFLGMFHVWQLKIKVLKCLQWQSMGVYDFLKTRRLQVETKKSN